MKIDYKGITISYEVHGDGDSVVLLHGFLENARMWKFLIPKLSSSHRVISIDLLGHGHSECLGYVHSMEMMAEAVEAVLTHLELTSVMFIGHSMGGYVALAFAELFPDRIKGLCLMNSTASSDSPEKQLNRERAIAAVKYNHEVFIRISISNLFAAKNRERLAHEIEKVKTEALKIPLQGIIAALEGMKIRTDRTELFQKVVYKKMLIIGIKDPVLDYKSLIDQVSGTDIETVEFPDGHMSYIENTKELTYRLMHFIEK